MNAGPVQKGKGPRQPGRVLLFPVIVLAIYGVLFVAMPDKALLALESSGKVLRNIALPLGIVFGIMLVLNLFVKPAQITKFIGRRAGTKGIMLSAGAGIISAGPIYVWYPLLKELREKGAGASPIAVFLYSRSVKPFLLPIMIAYFGWQYVVILTGLTVLGAIALGYSLEFLVKERDGW